MKSYVGIGTLCFYFCITLNHYHASYFSCFNLASQEETLQLKIMKELDANLTCGISKEASKKLMISFQFINALFLSIHKHSLPFTVTYNDASDVIIVGGW